MEHESSSHGNEEKLHVHIEITRRHVSNVFDDIIAEILIVSFKSLN